MILTAWDMVGIMIALSVSLVLIVTTAIANARLTESRNYWRSLHYKQVNAVRIPNDEYHACTCAECD